MDAWRRSHLVPRLGARPSTLCFWVPCLSLHPWEAYCAHCLEPSAARPALSACTWQLQEQAPHGALIIITPFMAICGCLYNILANSACTLPWVWWPAMGQTRRGGGAQPTPGETCTMPPHSMVHFKAWDQDTKRAPTGYALIPPHGTNWLNSCVQGLQERGHKGASSMH